MTNRVNALFVKISLVTVATLAGATLPQYAYGNACRTAIYLLTSDIPLARAPDPKVIDPRLLDEWICTVRRLDPVNAISLTGVADRDRPTLLTNAQAMLAKVKELLEALVQRPGAAIGQSEFTRIAHATFQQGLQEAALEMFGRIPASEAQVYFIFDDSSTGNSNRWVFHLLVDSLRTRPDLLAKIRILEPGDLRGVAAASVRRVVVIDDASYSGTQVGSVTVEAMDQFPNLAEVEILVPFMTMQAHAAVNEDIAIRNETRPVDQHVQVRFPSRTTLPAGQIRSLREIYDSWQLLPAAQRPSLTEANMREIFNDQWESLTVTFFDHKVADEVSVVSFPGTGVGRPIFAGPVPSLRPYALANGGYRIKVRARSTQPQFIPFVTNYATTPYPNDADRNLYMGNLFRYPARPATP